MTKPCSQCQHDNRDTSHFCQKCGAALADTPRDPAGPSCFFCGLVNNSQAKFCKGCGRSLTTTASSRSTPILPETLAGGTGMLSSNHRLQNGRYSILKRIGQGGMGAVYLAEDTRLGHSKWAIKEMSDSHLDADEKTRAVESFQQEAHLMATMLNHPNIPRVIDYFSENGKKYLVMAYVDGETLEEKLHHNQGRPLPEKEVMSWAVQLCDVLHYLHSLPQPIIFRDIKPANIMVDGKGQIKLIDFGIARLFKPGQTKDTTRLGSPGYAPPEQYGKGQTDARSDVYALGATLHHLLTGHDPSVDPFKFKPPYRLNAQVSRPISEVLMTALISQPDNRFKDMVALQQALATAATKAGYTISLPVSSTPPSLPSVPHMGTPPVLPPVLPVASPHTNVTGRRLVAHLVDGIILAAVFTGYFFILISIMATMIYDPAWDYQMVELATLIGGGLFALMTYLIYFTFFHALYGQTVGKMLANIEVIQSDGRSISWPRSFWRALTLLTSQIIGSVACLGIFPYLFPLLTKNRQAAHDLLARTLVVYKTKRK